MFEWYVWLAIGVGIVALAVLKIVVMKKLVEAQMAKKAAQAVSAEDRAG